MVFSPTANVYQVKNLTLVRSHLKLILNRGVTWELDAAGGKLTGVQRRGAATEGTVEGVRAPALKRNEPRAWTTPEPLFNGRDLTGWEPAPASAGNYWVARRRRIDQ